MSPPSPCDPSPLLARVLPISCLLACLVGALEDYAVVSRDLVSDLGGSSMREKKNKDLEGKVLFSSLLLWHSHP